MTASIVSQIGFDAVGCGETRVDSSDRETSPGQHERGIFALHQHHIVARLPGDAVGNGGGGIGHVGQIGEAVRRGVQQLAEDAVRIGQIVLHASGPAPMGSPAARPVPRSPGGCVPAPVSRRHGRDRPGRPRPRIRYRADVRARALVSFRGMGSSYRVAFDAQPGEDSATLSHPDILSASEESRMALPRDPLPSRNPVGAAPRGRPW